MNQKKRQILEAAIKCFAKKGFHATSIQDIVDEVGIAKGSVYVYYKSKEDLLISALQYAFGELEERLLSIHTNTGVSPKERLSGLLQAQIEVISKYSQFTLMVMSEQTILINEEMRSFFLKTRMVPLHFFYEAILKVYGPEAEAYALDAVVILQSLMHQFIFNSMIDQVEIDSTHLLSFIMERLDETIKGMINKKQKPILTKEQLPLFQLEIKDKESEKKEWLQKVDQLRKEIERWSPGSSNREELLSYLLILKHELKKVEPNPIMVSNILQELHSFDQTGKLAQSIENLVATIHPIR